jgi:demethylmenaquinone methyltransferase / 2-methoxy-6-polyprenyl-1,4-benzoquinol methylase
MLEFAVPSRALPRGAWEAYSRLGLPLAGRAVSPGWAEVGAFLGPSIRDFWSRYPAERLRGVWEGAGVSDVRARLLSFGGGIVMWGTRGD